MAALSSLSFSKTVSVVLVRPELIPLPPAQQTGALSAELTRRRFSKVMTVKGTPKKWKWLNYSGTPLYGPRVIRTPICNGQFRLSRPKKSSTYIFSKINPLNSDTITCPVILQNTSRLYWYVCKHQHFATREVLWFGPYLVMYEAEKYVFWEPSLLHFMF